MRFSDGVFDVVVIFLTLPGSAMRFVYLYVI